MSIDTIVPQIERFLKGTKADQDFGGFFSIRHAEELHAVGYLCDIAPDRSTYTQVCLSIAVTTMVTEEIWVRIFWKRSQKEFPPEDCPGWKFPLSDEGARSFEEHWPAIRRRMVSAISRRHPPSTLRSLWLHAMSTLRNAKPRVPNQSTDPTP
jgi:hypothetical protein